MAALNPPQFPFPPIRYSPIQEAFRGALDVGMSELFQLPFQKMAMKRELSKYAQEQGIERATEINYMPAHALATRQSEINTGQVVPGSTLDPDTRANLTRAGAAPKYSFGGEDYYAPDALTGAKKYGLPVAQNVQSYIDDARKRMGLPKLTQPVTEGTLNEIATSMGMEIPAAQYQRETTQFEELRVDELIKQASTPGPEFLDFAQKVAFEQDPQHPGHLTRDYHDVFVYSKMPQYMQLLQNPLLKRPENAVFRKQIEQDLARAMELAPKVRYPDTYFPTKDDVDRTLATVRQASPAASMTSEAAIMARLAVKWGILKDPDTGRFVGVHGNVDDMGRAITALQHNPPLLEAMVYATKYGTMENMQWGGRIGHPYPTNKLTRDILEYQVFPAMGGGATAIPGIHDPNSPNYNPAAGAAPGPQYGEGGEGPAANVRTPTTVTGGGTSLVIPAGPGQVLGTAPSAGTAAVNQVGMSEGGQSLYNGIFTKTKADPTAFAAMRATMDSVFYGPPEHTLQILKSMAVDASLPLSQDDRNKLLLSVHQIEAAPAAKRPSLIAMLKYMVIAHSVQAREDALSQSLTVKPEATATKERPKPKEEKKQE
jgi:hypothetical protein